MYSSMNQQYIFYSLHEPMICQTLKDQFLKQWFSIYDSILFFLREFKVLFKTQFAFETNFLRLPEAS